MQFKKIRRKIKKETKIHLKAKIIKVEHRKNNSYNLVDENPGVG